MKRAEFEVCAAHLSGSGGPDGHWIPRVGDACTPIVHRLTDPRRPLDGVRCRVVEVRRERPTAWDRKCHVWGGSGIFYTLETIE